MLNKIKIVCYLIFLNFIYIILLMGTKWTGCYDMEINDMHKYNNIVEDEDNMNSEGNSGKNYSKPINKSLFNKMLALKVIVKN